MAELLVFSDRNDLAFELVSKGREFAGALKMGLSAALLGEKAGGEANEYFAYGANRVYIGENPALAGFNAESYAEALYQIAQKNDAKILLIPSTKRGKELAPRVAQKLGAGCVTDANAVELKDGDLLISRYALGGNTVAGEVIKTSHKVITVMPKTFELGPKEEKKGEVVKPDLSLKAPRVRIVERQEKVGEKVDLEAAEILVCIGRGLEKKEDLKIVEQLAKALGAEIGCTKSLCTDYQWLSEDRLVGLSGKKTSPRLVISLGISGQIQYTVGIRGARLTVAINKDKQAPIFAMSDYGVVGNLYDVVPLLAEKLKSA
ncbi:MAG TPA: electron transfer flavoprotein subunit alpha/FixB family protein [Thermodesulfobacteriota bacterium]|nr:electron transfer flavoprotein subunit alpha/FixB family protein [Thermodesulfobacteriota bacterium]